MSKTDIFKCKDEMPTSDYDRGRGKARQSPGESRDAPLPGLRMDSSMSVENLHKPAPATGRRP